MAKSSKPNPKQRTSSTSTARVTKIEKELTKDVPKPRIRKAETVRERYEKASAKSNRKTNKRPSKLRVAIAKIFKPLAKPFSIIAKPLKTRPMRLIGRVIGRILWPKYFRNSWHEVRQVSWPSRRDTWKLTMAVLIFALVFGLAASGIDWVLDKVIQRIVFRG